MERTIDMEARAHGYLNVVSRSLDTGHINGAAASREKREGCGNAAAPQRKSPAQLDALALGPIRRSDV